MRFLLSTLAIAALLVNATLVQAFSFAEEDAKQQAASRPKGGAPAALPAACRDRLKDERVTVLIAERGNSGFNADQSRYSLHFQGIDRRLQKQGMRTFSQDEVKKRVAQAEIDAYFRNDPDAAMGAAKKLGGTMFLRGVISSRRSINPVLGINEVAVHMSFALAGSDGRPIADAGASSESYSGSDTVGMALTLINEQADAVVGRLLRGYCAERGGKSKSDRATSPGE